MITYNHAPFIVQAIESVLAQQTRHPFELIIGDDCSNDATGKIVREYAEKYPNRITVLKRSRRLGMMQNFQQTLEACHGEAIAILEGDDYWLDTAKLERQATFLIQHPTHVICFSSAIVQDETRTVKTHVEIPEKKFRREVLTLNELLEENFIPTCTVLFRNKGLHLPSWFLDLDMGDYPLHLMIASGGNIGFIPGPTAVYRVHSGGNFSQRFVKKNLLALLDVYVAIDRHYNGAFHSTIENARKKALYKIASGHLANKEKSSAFPYILQVFRLWRYHRFVSYRQELGLLSRYILP